MVCTVSSFLRRRHHRQHERVSCQCQISQRHGARQTQTSTHPVVTCTGELVLLSARVLKQAWGDTERLTALEHHAYGKTHQQEQASLHRTLFEGCVLALPTATLPSRTRIHTRSPAERERESGGVCTRTMSATTVESMVARAARPREARRGLCATTYYAVSRSDARARACLARCAVCQWAFLTRSLGVDEWSNDEARVF